MDMLSIFLSRVQMGFSLGMHILFPTLNIGLAVFLCIMEYLWIKTDNPLYLKICKFWMKIFALAFGMGVVSGVVMAYQLGTNFGKFTFAIGEVLGPLFVYEVLTAFFLEAGFLGIMIFGWDRVSKKMHFLATFMVAFGTLISAFWILSANSWMQFPTGYIENSNGTFTVDNWMTAIFNPTLIPRFTHMILASFLTSTFFIAGISAYYLWKDKHTALAKKCFSFAMWSALILVPTQLFIGDAVGVNVHKYQPLKTAAIEGVWHTQKGAPLILLGYPDPDKEKNVTLLSIPKGASLVNTHDPNGELLGLTSVPREDRPVILATFFSFRVMVGIGLIFLSLALWALWLRRNNRLYQSRMLQWGCMLTTPLGFIATISGWITAESGRQPWVVYQKMRTLHGASDLSAIQVEISLAMFVLVYLFVLSFFLVYLFKLIKKGPADTVVDDHTIEAPTFAYMPPSEQGNASSC